MYKPPDPVAIKIAKESLNVFSFFDFDFKSFLAFFADDLKKVREHNISVDWYPQPVKNPPKGRGVSFHISFKDCFEFWGHNT